jgi:hypothetical protein
MTFHIKLAVDCTMTQRKPVEYVPARGIFGLRTAGPLEMSLRKRLGLEK